MAKDIKDYLHLYLLADVLVQGEERTGRLTGTMNGNYECEIQFRLVDNPHHSEEEPETVNADDVKLCLRPLSDISEEEKDAFIEICGLEPEDISCLVRSRDDFFPEPETSFGTAHLTNIAQWSVGVIYLLSKQFDLFQLIELGLAIDKTIL